MSVRKSFCALSPMIYNDDKMYLLSSMHTLVTTFRGKGIVNALDGLSSTSLSGDIIGNMSRYLCMWQYAVDHTRSLLPFCNCDFCDGCIIQNRLPYQRLLQWLWIDWNYQPHIPHHEVMCFCHRVFVWLLESGTNPIIVAITPSLLTILHRDSIPYYGAKWLTVP